MASETTFPYVTKLDILYKPLDLIDEKAVADACTHKWFNQTLCQVNDSVVRLGVLQGEYHWHQHDDEDEFFLVLEGQLLIDLEGRTIGLGPRQAVTIPRNLPHRPRAPQRTIVVMMEPAGVVPTGD